MKKKRQRLEPGSVTGIKQFLILLEMTVSACGYKYHLANCGQFLPKDDPARFEHRTRWAIRHSKPKWDPRSYYPVEAVWYCFFRLPGQPRHPSGSLISPSEVIGLSEEQAYKIMAAGENYEGCHKRLRADMLSACGLKEKI